MDDSQALITILAVFSAQDHPNIIRCYRCWQDSESKCINLITEFFTSGNLRDYRQRHKQRLDIKAVRKWARQVRTQNCLTWCLNSPWEGRGSCCFAGAQ